MKDIERVNEIERAVAEGQMNAAQVFTQMRQLVKASAQDGGEPVAWMRFTSTGGFEGPLHNCQIDDVRKASGAWTPLYPPSAVVPEDDLLLQDVANKICQHLPAGFELRLCMESGAAWVELSDDHGDDRTLPEIDDVCLAAQLNNALCVACGWTEQEQES
jgi:hypothetical protein